MHACTRIKPRNLAAAHRDANNDRQNPCPRSRCVRRSQGHLCPEERYSSSAACFGHSWTEWSKSSTHCHRPRGNYTPPAAPFEKDLQSCPGKQCVQIGFLSAKFGTFHQQGASPGMKDGFPRCHWRFRDRDFPSSNPPACYSLNPSIPPEQVNGVPSSWIVVPLDISVYIYITNINNSDNNNHHHH